MNILVSFVTDYYPSGTGFAQAFYHFHNALLDNKSCDKVYVFATTESSNSDREDIEIFNIGKIKGQRILQNGITRGIGRCLLEKRLQEALYCLDEIVRKNDVQMIMLESMFMAWLIPTLKKRYRGIPIVCRIHGTGPEYTAYLRNRIVTRFNDYLLDELFKNEYIAVTTEFYTRFFNDLYHDYSKFMDKDFFVIPNTTLPLMNDKVVNKGHTKIKLLQLGRMDLMGYHQKGFQDTIKALLYLEEIASELMKNTKYITIGCGDKLGEFLQACSNLKYVEHVHFDRLPNEHVKEIELESDVILLPSRCEGMSMFATEVLAAGKPIINTTKNGMDCMCKDGVNSLGMEYYDYLKLAENIKRLVENEDLRKQYGEESSRIYNAEFSYTAIAKKYNAVVRYLGRN